MIFNRNEKFNSLLTTVLLGESTTVRYYKIPANKIPEGVQRSLSNARKYAEDSRLLLENRSLDHAVVFAVFAAEELAKASLLSQRLQQQKGRETIEVESIIFQGRDAHDYKINEAKRILGSLLLESSRLGSARLPFRLGGYEVEASPETRLQCAFVDWDNDDWQFGTSYDSENMEDLLRGIEENIARLQKNTN